MQREAMHAASKKHLVLQKYQLYIHHICSRGFGHNETLD